MTSKSRRLMVYISFLPHISQVIAERIVPVDYEFNVWRKSQAIVTRQIEIDLLANDQRRRLYAHVMESASHAGRVRGAGYTAGVCMEEVGFIQVGIINQM